MEKQVLIGGTGYIDYYGAMALEAAGYDALVFNNLPTVHAEFSGIGRYIAGDLADRATTDRPVAVTEAPGTPDDSARLVGNAQRTIAEPDWKPHYADLETIVCTTWDGKQTLGSAPAGATPCA